MFSAAYEKSVADNRRGCIDGLSEIVNSEFFEFTAMTNDGRYAIDKGYNVVGGTESTNPNGNVLIGLRLT